MWRYLSVVMAGAIGLSVLMVALLVPAVHALSSAGSNDGAEDVNAQTTLNQRSVVYARDGSVLTTFHGVEDRDPVTFNQIPRVMINAVVDTEDSKFWDHHGVNPAAIGRALLSDLGRGKLGQGGSTITQQLIKNTVLTPQKKFGRKVKEAVLAVRLEGQLSKPQILERYLNTIYFGAGAYGVNAAAGVYFGVNVDQLKVDQAAFLAGMINNPSGNDPYRFPVASKVRRNFVVDRMLKQGDVSPKDADFIKLLPVPTVKHLDTRADNLDSYFTQEVSNQLDHDVRLGDNPTAAHNFLLNGGLKIYSTLDPVAQAAAKKALADNLPTENGKWSGTLVSVEPSTGAVRALIGGQGHDQSQIDLATSMEQPGSSFKPFVLATAFQEGYQPTAGVDGTSPCVFPGANSGKSFHNDDPNGPATGYTDMTTAMAYSINCAYLRIGSQVGLRNVVKLVRALGITLPSDSAFTFSLPIGTKEVQPVRMAAAYAAFANDGVHHEPFYVERVVDRQNRVILTGGDKGNVALTPQKAREVVQALRSVVTYPGATGLLANLSDRQVAGKTGTTDNNGNAWFVGFAPQLATAVWMGAKDGTQFMKNVGGKTASGIVMTPRDVFGGTYPAMIWHQFMSDALRAQPAIPFATPDPFDLGNLTFIPSASAPTGRPTTTLPPAPVTTAPPVTTPATPTTAGGDTTTTAGDTTTTRHPRSTIPRSTIPFPTFPTIPFPTPSPPASNPQPPGNNPQFQQ